MRLRAVVSSRLLVSVGLLLVAGLGLAAGGCDDDPDPDAGLERDAGGAPVDAFVPLDRDSGPTTPDAGPVPVDAGPGVDACVPAAETCNGLDDDCDGDTDEAFDLESDDTNCGTCGVTCEGAEVCFLGACGPDIPRAVAVSAGRAHTCVRMSDGDVRCFGANGLGQLGQGDTEAHAGVLTVMDLSNIVALDVGADHACGITRSNVTVCWGDDGRGQIGNRAPVGAPAPATIPAGVSGGIVGVEQVSVGHATSCAGSPFGSLHCWGANDDGQIGDGTTTQQDSAVAVMRGGRLMDLVSTGENHTCALARVTGEDPEVFCWGGNAEGAFGSGGFTGASTPVSTGFSRSSAVQTGAGVTCVITASGGVQCAGRNRRGALGDGVTSHADFDLVDRSATPVTVGLSGVRTLSLTHEHACAVLDDGTVRCWGANGDGQLGDGAAHATCQDMPASDCAFSPVAVDGLTDVVDVAAGAAHSCAVTRDARVLCWGANESGQLGVSGAEDRTTPTLVAL